MDQRPKFGMRRRLFVLTLSLAAVAPTLSVTPRLFAQEQSATTKTDGLREQIVEKGIAFLAREGQSDAGTFSDKVGPGVTALAVTAAIKNGRSIDDPVVAKGLEALQGYVKPDGGIYGNGRLKNYETCVAMVCFAAANPSGKYNEILKNAKNFVSGFQYGEGQRESSDPWYGGVGIRITLPEPRLEIQRHGVRSQGGRWWFLL